MKWKILLLVLVFALALTSCENGPFQNSGTDQSQESSYEQIQKKLVEMESYQADATVEYISNKGSNVYTTKQQAKTDGKYRVEVTSPDTVAGNITMSNNEVVCQYNPRVSNKVSVSTTDSQERSEIFLTSFTKNYLNSQEVSVSVGSFGEGNCTVLEAIVPGGHPYLATEKLWVDNETLKPVKLVVYDPEGVERIVVLYENFEYNVPLDDSLFTLEPVSS